MEYHQPQILIRSRSRLRKSKPGSVRPGHKYLSRTGRPGHYEYRYSEVAGDLFGGVAIKDAGDQESEMARVPVTAIHRDPTQPREHFDQKELKELGASIKKIGLVQAMSIRPHPDAKGEFMIIAGERRWRAMQIAGVEVAKVEIFHTTDEKKIAAIQVAENVGRAQMNPMEEARAFQKMVNTGSSPQQVAEAVGTSTLTVERRLLFLKLIPSLQELIRHGSLTIRRAEVIANANLRPQFQQNIIKRLNMGRVSIEALRGMVGRYQTAQTQTGLFASEGNSIDQRVHKTRRTSLERDLARLLEDFGNVLGRIGEKGGAKIVPALAKVKGKLAVTARKVAMIKDEVIKIDREMQFAVQYFEGGGNIDGYLNTKGIKGKRKRRRMKKALVGILVKTRMRRGART